MKKNYFLKVLKAFIDAHRRSKTFRSIMISLASITVFVTTYALILPAITLELRQARNMAGVNLGSDQIQDEDLLAEDESDTLDEAGEEKVDARTGQPADTQQKSNGDYLVNDENGMSDEDWDALIEDGFFADDTGEEQLTEDNLEVEQTEEITEGGQEKAEELAEDQVEDITEAISEEPEEATEAQAEEKPEEATEAQAEEASEALTETATEETTEVQTEETTESQTEETTERQTEEKSAWDYPAAHFEVYTNYMYVRVEAEAGAFPEGTTIQVEDIEDADTIETITAAVDGTVTRVHAVDITFYDAHYHEIEPKVPIKVYLTELQGGQDPATQNLFSSVPNHAYAASPDPAYFPASNSADVSMPDTAANLVPSPVQNASPDQSEEKPVIVHLEENGQTQLIDADVVENRNDPAASDISFEADAFSVYALVYAQLNKTVIDAKGDTWLITVTYDKDAQIPDNAQLVVEEILPEDTDFEEYLKDAASEVGLSVEKMDYARFFDIEIQDEQGNQIEPSSPVSVSMVMLDQYEQSGQELCVVHFTDEQPVVMDAACELDEEKKAFSFQTDSFSTYGVITSPEPSVENLDGVQFTMNRNGSYVTANLNGNKLAQSNNAGDAALWQFESAGNGQYNIFTETNGSRQYINITNAGDNGNASLSDNPQAFSVTKNSNGTYSMSTQADGRTYYLNHYGGNNGFAGWYSKSAPND